jgi:hypothetical protein
MKVNCKSLFLFLLLLSAISSYCQVVQGAVYDINTKEPLQGATVYLDGTTINTITDADGSFSVDAQGNNASLVVRFIGYSTFSLDNPSKSYSNKLKVFLDKESINLDEVLVGKGLFTRKQMMRAFKRQFLGESKAGRSCKIENEKDIILYYDVSNNTLNAASRNSLKIINNHMGYEVNFDLKELVVHYNFQSLKKQNQTQSVFFGTTFYKDISENKLINKKRDEAFYGSATHLIHTLANDTWEKENLKLFVNGVQTSPSIYFDVKDSLNWKKVTLIKEPQMMVKKFKKEYNASRQIIITETDEYETRPSYLHILYQGDKHSIVEFKSKVIFVDKNGNYNPIFGVVYGGYIGSLKAGDMLPIDYLLNNKEIQKRE